MYATESRRKESRPTKLTRELRFGKLARKLLVGSSLIPPLTKLSFGQELCSFHRLKGLLSCVFLIWMVFFVAFSTFFLCCCVDVVLYFGISFKDFRFVRHITCWFLISLYFLV